MLVTTLADPSSTAAVTLQTNVTNGIKHKIPHCSNFKKSWGPNLYHSHHMKSS